MRFSSIPRGARLARRLVSHRLNDWGHPYTTPANETLTLITAGRPRAAPCEPARCERGGLPHGRSRGRRRVT